MSKEQTAVGQAIQKLKDLGIYTTTLSGILEEAKEMEKKQIAKGFDDGQDIEYEYHINSVKRQFNDGKEYYNDTYGK